MKKINNFWVIIGTFFIYVYASIFVSNFFEVCFITNSRILNSICLILSNLLVALLVALPFVKQLVDDFKKINKDNLKKSYKNWLIGLGLMFVSNAIISIFIKDIATNEQYNRELLSSMPIYAISVMVIIAPITEELVFRLSLKNSFKNKWIYAVVSGLIFGLVHLLSASNLIELLYIIPYGALGFFFAKSVYESDSIYSSIFTHITHNALMITILFLSHSIGA